MPNYKPRRTTAKSFLYQPNVTPARNKMRCPCASDNRIVNKLASRRVYFFRGQHIREVASSSGVKEGSPGWLRQDAIRGQHIRDVAASRRAVASGWSQRAAHWGGSALGRRAAAAASRRVTTGSGLREESGSVVASRRGPAAAASGRAAAAGIQPASASSSSDRAIVTRVKAYEWAIATIYGIEYLLP
jgi:hypothetical protein